LPHLIALDSSLDHAGVDLFAHSIADGVGGTSGDVGVPVGKVVIGVEFAVSSEPTGFGFDVPKGVPHRQ